MHRYALRIRDKLGERVDALVGMDVLRDYYFRAQSYSSEFVMSQSSFAQEGIFWSCDTDAPLMRVGFECGTGSKMRAYVDTGAKQSFILERHARAWPRVGTTHDFSPFVGEFDAALHRIPVKIVGRDITLDFATIPEFYVSSGMMRGVDAVLGNDLWEHFDITYSPPASGLWLVPTPS